MTQLAAATVRVWVDEGVPSGQCFACGVYAEQASGDRDDGAFLRAHPAGLDRPHAPGVPAGWVVPLSGPGALSQ